MVPDGTAVGGWAGQQDLRASCESLVDAELCLKKNVCNNHLKEYL